MPPLPRSLLSLPVLLQEVTGIGLSLSEAVRTECLARAPRREEVLKIPRAAFSAHRGGAAERPLKLIQFAQRLDINLQEGPFKFIRNTVEELKGARPWLAWGAFVASGQIVPERVKIQHPTSPSRQRIGAGNRSRLGSWPKV